jgi:hypothetical protein
VLLFPLFIVSIDVTKEDDEEWGKEDLFEWRKKKMVLNTRVYTDKEGREKKSKRQNGLRHLRIDS